MTEYKHIITYAGKGAEMYNLTIGSDGSVEGTFKKEPIKIINILGRLHVNNHHWPIYRLVWEAFKGKTPKGYVIHHIDHNKLNDRLDNLMLMTNEEHSRLHNTNPSPKKRQMLSEAASKRKGELNPFYGGHCSEENKQKLRERNSGENSSIYGKHVYNNGIREKYFYTDEEAMNEGYMNKGKIFKHRRRKRKNEETE